MKSRQRLAVEFAGLGSYVPERVLTNHELEGMVDTSDEWIVQRTGIRERHIAADDQATSDLAIEAAGRALEAAQMEAGELDAVLVATCSPDYIFPATACLVQAAIGAQDAMACDLEAACSGFVYGMSWGSALIASGMAGNVLLIGAETLSRVTNYADRESCILFGDGAGAAVLRPSQNGGEIIYNELGADGSWPDILRIPAGAARLPASHETVDAGLHYMHLEGRDVFKLAVGKLIELLRNLPEQTGIQMDDIKMIIPHQSNVRIINSALERSGIDPGKAYLNIDRVGNTSAASIPTAMDEAVRSGALQRGDLALLLAFGGGLTWGCTLLRF